MSALSLAAIHPAHMLVGAAPQLRATIRVHASGIGPGGIAACLRLWTPLGASLAELGERAPATRDLRERAIRLDDRTLTCAAGRWRDGEREYELVIALPPGRAGDEILAARLAVLVGDVVAARVPLAVTWTDDEDLVAMLRLGAHVLAAPSAVNELPTGRSPAPRHTLGAVLGGRPSCSACDLRGNDGDRFCERCGASLAGAQKS